MNWAGPLHSKSVISNPEEGKKNETWNAADFNPENISNQCHFSGIYVVENFYLIFDA